MTYWALIWDLDGTIIDSGRDGLARFFIVARERGLPITAEMEQKVMSMWGQNPRELITSSWSKENVEAFYADWVAYDAAHPHKLLEGADSLIQELAAWKFYQAISTSRSRKTTLTQLDHNKLTDCFNRIVCSDDSPYKKPDPRSCEAIVEDLKAFDLGYPKGVLYIGDSLTDYELALALGVTPKLILAGSLSTKEEFLASGVPEESILESIQDLSDMLDADL
ncbi:MAG: hypothetical protein A3A97_02030 [Candidatus Terrybacteria bacterium RIFCSPLOWO2_01_FULL_40_23]|uniref:HAD family hydrolase n=1 Tax=Candidatus Terrybacteria bacterium RIFCSPLOWO2_01_FULL_40_23 TaxID=1802366 RepID=A0A1G2PQQ6_9BACT|nr:MAG: hypothetical protein A3A97_02030 [Candidatus Terrybacteria bacterium RIFCSPLOWO2_01_FULL_40_23]